MLHARAQANGAKALFEFLPPADYRVFLGSVTNGSGILQERAVVGEPAMNSDRRRAIEPGEERQFLHVIGETVRGIEDGGSQGSAERVTKLQVVLASSYLSYMPPRRRRIVAERIVHPFRDFMRSDRDIWNRADENFASVEIYGSESLCPDCIMEAKNAAGGLWSQLSAICALALHYVVEEKHRKCTWSHPLRSKPG